MIRSNYCPSKDVYYVSGSKYMSVCINERVYIYGRWERKQQVAFGSNNSPSVLAALSKDVCGINNIQQMTQSFSLRKGCSWFFDCLMCVFLGTTNSDTFWLSSLLLIFCSLFFGCFFFFLVWFPHCNT